MIDDNALDDLMYSDAYAEYIMRNCNGERVICNGDTLLQAMEDEYLFKDFVAEYLNLTEEMAS